MANSAKEILVVAAVIQREFPVDGKVLIVKRGQNQSGAGDWEFPGGKVEEGETLEEALIREIQEELGIQIRVSELLGENRHHYPSKVIWLKVYRAFTSQEAINLTEHDDFKWCHPEDICIDELSAADRPFVEILLSEKK